LGEKGFFVRARVTVGVFLLTLAGGLCLPSVAHALDRQAAKRLYNEGMAAYNLDDYVKAVERFKASYEQCLDPALLYNIAQAYRLGGDRAQALSFYRKYLRSAPRDARNRSDADARVKELEAQQLEPRAPGPAETASPPAAAPPVPEPAPSPRPPAPPPAAAAPPPAQPVPARPPVAVEAAAPPPAPAPAATGTWRPVVGWSAVGAGAVALGLGIVEALGGQSKLDEAVSDASKANVAHDPVAYQNAQKLYQDGTSQRTLGRILVGAGGVAVVGGVVLVLIGSSPKESRAVAMRVGPWMESGGGGILWSGRW
jgi:tetratricopeptide (TPR) repeat protein